MIEKSDVTKLACTVFFFFAGAASAQELMSLAQAIEIGLHNNYQITIARNDATISQNNVTLGNAGFLPEINLSASVTHSSTDTKQEFVSGNTIDRKGAQSDARNAGVALSWTIFDGFNMFVAYGQLKQLREIGEYNAKLTVETTVAEIIKSYYTVVKEGKVYKAKQDAVDISEQRVATANSKYRLGSGSKLELLQAQVALNADRSALLRQEVTLSNAKTSLNQLLARDPQLDFTVGDSITVVYDLSLDALKTAMLAENNILGIARRNKKLAQLDLRGIQSQWLPRLGLNLGYNYAKSESKAGFVLSNQNLGFTVGLTASVNLFDGLNTRREAENARLLVQSNAIAYEETKNQLDAELTQTHKSYQNNLQLVTLERENVKVAKENLDIALEKFKLGSITSVELREAQNQFIEAENRLVGAEYEAKAAETDLRRLSGQIIKQP